jgi:hypothetical protein
MPIFWHSTSLEEWKNFEGRNKLCSTMLMEKKQHPAHCPNPLKITEIYIVYP